MEFSEYSKQKDAEAKKPVRLFVTLSMYTIG